MDKAYPNFLPEDCLTRILIICPSLKTNENADNSPSLSMFPAFSNCLQGTSRA